MPVTPAQNGPSASVLAYNGDSPRGWNDPPTFAFSKSTGSRPKLDLRKRVSHQQALHGTKTPPYSPSTPSTYGVRGDEVDRMASLSMQSPPVTTGTISSVPHSVAQPHQPEMMHNHPTVPLYTPSPTTSTNYAVHDHHRSLSLPTINVPSVSTAPNAHVDPVSTPDIQQALSANSLAQSSQPPGYLGQPLFALKNHLFEPVKTHNDSCVRSTAEIGDHLDEHAHSGPQIYHPIHQSMRNGMHSTAPPMGSMTPMLGTTQPGRVSPLQKGARPLSPHPAIPVAPPPAYSVLSGTSALSHPVMPVTSTLTNPTSINSLANLQSTAMSHAINAAAPPPVGHLKSSVEPQPIPQPNMGSVASTPPPVDTRTPTPPTGFTPPPPASRSTGSTPRCLSPEQDDNEINDEEGLKTTVDALNDVIKKFELEKRICDDIAKKLQIMSKMWMEGKLGKTVKSRMIRLAKALDDGKGEEAHQIHVSIIVDHVAEVNQWMVAVKRLISLVRQQPAVSS